MSKVHVTPTGGKIVVSHSPGDGSYLAMAMLAAGATGTRVHGPDCGCCACLAPTIDADDSLILDLLGSDEPAGEP